MDMNTDVLVFRTGYALLVQSVEFGSYVPTVTGSNPVRSIFLCFTYKI